MRPLKSTTGSKLQNSKKGRVVSFSMNRFHDTHVKSNLSVFNQNPVLMSIMLDFIYYCVLNFNVNFILLGR